MTEWSGKYKRLIITIRTNSHQLFQELAKFLMMDLYVDDSGQAIYSFPPGTIIDMEKLELTIDPAMIEEHLKIPADRRAFDILTTIANSIDKDIVVKADVASDHPELNFKIPFLDNQIWMKHKNPLYPRGQFLHMHYRKPMATEILLVKGTAIDQRTVRTIHTQQLIRILRNNHKDIDMKDHNQTITNYMQILMNSGYNEQYRRDIMISGHNAFAKQIEDNNTGKKPMYRPKEWRREMRDEAKNNSQEWFKKSGDHNQIMMIPQTPNSTLKKEIEKNIAPFNQKLKIKVVERAGPRLVDVLKGKINKTERPPCPDITKCMVCKHGDKKSGNCQTQEVVYQIKCKGKDKKNNQDCTSEYIGETGRNCFARSKEHIEQAEAKTKPKNKEEHFIIQHIKKSHNNQMQDFQMKILESFQNDALGRRCAEAVQIDLLGNNKMNTKREWRQPCNITATYTRNDNIQPITTTTNNQEQSNNQAIKQPSKKQKTSNQTTTKTSLTTIVEETNDDTNTTYSNSQTPGTSKDMTTRKESTTNKNKKKKNNQLSIDKYFNKK